jgi:hypothetical protein
VVALRLRYDEKEKMDEFDFAIDEDDFDIFEEDFSPEEESDDSFDYDIAWSETFHAQWG